MSTAEINKMTSAVKNAGVPVSSEPGKFEAFMTKFKHCTTAFKLDEVCAFNLKAIGESEDDAVWM